MDTILLCRNCNTQYYASKGHKCRVADSKNRASDFVETKTQDHKKADRSLLYTPLGQDQDRFVIAYCRNCGDISAMAVANTAMEKHWANEDLDEWEADSRHTEVIIKDSEDKQPKWCSCGNCR